MRHPTHPQRSGAGPTSRHGAWTGGAATLALAAALLVGLAGCGTPSAQQIYDNSTSSKMRDAALTFTGASNGSSSLGISGDGEIVKKPAAFKLHLVLQLNSAQTTGSVTIDDIEVSQKDYTKINTSISGLGDFGSDKYTVSDASSDTAASLTPKLTHLKLVGEDTIRGDKCWHITGSSTDASGQTSTDNLWVRESDYYPVREKLSALPGVSLPSGTGNGALDVSLTIDFSHYDTGTVIDAPPASEIG
ncbi:MAG TPA: hypothetical protein VGR57_09750 [Ktedonobacterales bacterium]|nr:hypothetical protein [Ktedonobacterales bacterium]